MGRRRRARKNPDWSEAQGPGNRFYSYEGDALEALEQASKRITILQLHLERDPKNRRRFWAALTTPSTTDYGRMETVKGKFLSGRLAEAKKQALEFALEPD